MQRDPLPRGTVRTETRTARMMLRHNRIEPGHSGLLGGSQTGGSKRIFQRWCAMQFPRLDQITIVDEKDTLLIPKHFLHVTNM